MVMLTFITFFVGNLLLSIGITQKDFFFCFGGIYFIKWAIVGVN